MRIHAGTSGTLPREVGRSLSGHDQVLLQVTKVSVVLSFWGIHLVSTLELLKLTCAQNLAPKLKIDARSQSLSFRALQKPIQIAEIKQTAEILLENKIAK